MRVKYYENKDLAIFDGEKFRRDKKTGYYLCSKLRKRLHRYVYEYYNGEIPKGYDIHHKIDKYHNDIEDLELKKKSEHRQYHKNALTEEQREWYRDNMNKVARPKAIEWHKSKKGIEWHKEHYVLYKEKFKEVKQFSCENCGKKFQSSQQQSRFCSNRCKSQWRRKNGLDNEIRICKYCGKEFSTNKYKKTVCCSKTCSNKLFPRLPQLKDSNK